jgi:hypothetical protein
MGREFKVILQPDEISCGPSCVAMIRRELGIRHGVSSPLGVGHFGSMCGTNDRIGTVPAGLDIAFAGLGVAADFRSGGGRDRVLGDSLEALARGDLVLCRTLTNGVKHWTLAHGFEAGRFDVADPWLGTRRLNPAEFLEPLRLRGFDRYVVDMSKPPLDVRLAGRADIESCGGVFEEAKAALLDIGYAAFAPHGGPDPRWVMGVLADKSDWDISRFLLVDGRVVGGYLLAEGGPAVAGDWGSSVEGVGLVVADSERGRGYGRLLRDEPQRMGYDTVWGMQLKSLGNIDAWLASREIISQNDWLYVTARALKGPSVSMRLGMPVGTIPSHDGIVAGMGR